MTVFNISCAAPSKQFGLKPAIGDTFVDVNGQVYRTKKAKRATSCSGCDFSDWKNPANEVLCRHVVCASCWRQDARAVIFERIKK